MSEMLERVAAALTAEFQRQNPTARLNGKGHELARVAVAAMREPTAEMMSIFMHEGGGSDEFQAEQRRLKTGFGFDSGSAEWYGNKEQFKADFARMIDEALK